MGASIHVILEPLKRSVGSSPAPANKLPPSSEENGGFSVVFELFRPYRASAVVRISLKQGGLVLFMDALPASEPRSVPNRQNRLDRRPH